MCKVGFNLPPHMSAQTAAETFNCFIIGPRAYHNPVLCDGTRVHGPWFDAKTDSWKLDRSGHFQMNLYKDGRSGEIVAEDPEKLDMLQAMVFLLEHQHTMA